MWITRCALVLQVLTAAVCTHASAQQLCPGLDDVDVKADIIWMVDATSNVNIALHHY